MGGQPCVTMLIREAQGLLWQQIHLPQQIPEFTVGWIPNAPRSEEGRAKTRVALRQMLAQFCGADIAFEESPTGPIIPLGRMREMVTVSISYADEASWVALARGLHVGIDAVALQDCTSCELVAPHYFKPDMCMALRRAENPAEAFALQWTAMEARLKAARLPLMENPELPDAQIYSMVLPDVALSVALLKKGTIQP